MDLHPEDVEMSAHVAGYLCLLSPWKAVPAATLPTLAYLADRLGAKEAGHPIGRGPWTMTERGPVIARTLSLTEGAAHHPKWGSLLERGGDLVRLRPGVGHDALDMLSIHSERMIAQVWNAHGSRSPDDLRAWATDPANLPEIAAAVDGDIGLNAIMRGVGHDEDAAAHYVQHVTDMNGIDDTFRNMRTA